MQQKKNIRLFTTWVILLGLTIAVGIFRPDADRLDIDKGHFSLKEKVNEIDQITIVSTQSSISLQKKGRNWLLNNDHAADPSKINDILGVLSEVSVRRRVASNVQEQLDSNEIGKRKVTLLSNNKIVRTFEVAENDQGTLTYFIDEVGYVVNIPGYNYHVANIFKITSSDWRSPYVFASNWTDLDQMSISYPNSIESSFEIVYDKMRYSILSITELDTATMYDYMQRVSVLQVESFLPQIDSISKLSDLTISVKDVGGQQITLEFYLYEELALAHIDSTEWAIFNLNQVSDLLKHREDFTQQ